MAESVKVFYRGHWITRDVNTTINVQDFVGTPGYPWLIIAANTHLSASNIEEFLFQSGIPGVDRPETWIKKRRRLFQKPGTNNAKGPLPDVDGAERRAIELMRQHPKVSARNLSALLKQQGIIRSREWVRGHRCDWIVTFCPAISKT